MSNSRTCIASLVVLAGLAAAAGAAIPLSAGAVLPAAQRPSGAVIADLNGDALADLVVTADTPDRLIIWLRTGDGTFAAPVNVPVGGSGPRDVAASDIDGDGDRDLVVVLHNSNVMRSFLNNGAGQFTTGSSANIGSNARGLTVADFNGDGRSDFAVANRDSDTVSVVIAGANGVLSSTTFGGGGTEPRAVAAGDFDGDGDMDLAVTNHDSRNLAILPNLGGGAFGASTSIATPDRPEGVGASDLDGDGDIDLAVAQDALVRFYRNNGGAFTAAGFAAVGGQDTDAVVLADLDGDGDKDIITNDGSTSTISVLQNNGNLAFVLSTMAAGIHPEAIAVGNLGGSSAPDLAVPARDSNSVAIFINGSAGSTANVAPIARAGADQTVTDADGNGVQAVTLNGSASTDADGSIASYVWREGALVLGTGAVLTTNLGLGTHQITLTVTDNGNVSASDAVVVTVNAGLPACRADMDNGTGNGVPDGGVTIDDLLYYLQRFSDGC